MNRRDFLKKIETLPERAPLTSKFITALEKKYREPGLFYRKHKNQWQRWVGDHKKNPKGLYRRMKGGRPARFIYNQLKNPLMLLWLIEACGTSKDLVQAAIRTALYLSDSLQLQCAVIRHVMPWDMVEKQLNRRKPT
jgi:hypothetical protein